MGYAEDVDGPTGTALFGKRVRKYQGDTSVIRSQAHADAAAHSELINRRDLQASIALGMVPDPRLDVVANLDDTTRGAGSFGSTGVA